MSSATRDIRIRFAEKAAGSLRRGSPRDRDSWQCRELFILLILTIGHIQFSLAFIEISARWALGVYWSTGRIPMNYQIRS